MEKSWIEFLDDTVHSSIIQVDAPIDFPTIFKVPDYIRSYDPRAYNPVFVSLGPCHHQYSRANANLSLSLIDKLKLYYLKKFLKPNPKYTFNYYIQMIKNMEMKVRNAYSEPVMMSSDYFVLKMLLDCYFVIEVSTSILSLFKAKMETPNDDIEIAADDDIETELLINPIISSSTSRWKLVMDMLLLENQLPLFLLERLFGCISDDHYWDGNFSSLMLNIFNNWTSASWSLDIKFSEEAYHFLHLFHSSFCTSSDTILKNYRSATSMEDCTLQDPFMWVPSATQLQDAGVRFEKDNDEKKNFLFVTFERERMKFPQLIVDEYTGTLFRNLIAFEQCYAKRVKTSKQLHHMGVEDQYFSMYAWLMNFMINVDADVKLLQGKGILINLMGNDEDVARLFNDLPRGTLVYIERTYLRISFKSLNKHWNTDFNKWKAKLNHDYLSSPWAGISLFGVVTLFILTALQTTYTVISYY